MLHACEETLIPNPIAAHQSNHIFPNQAAANQATMTAMLSINNGKGSTRSAKSANPQHSIK
jgi:hypothetical protein